MTPDPVSSRAEALERVRSFLRAHGTPEDEIAEAEERDVLDLLVADRLLVPAERRYTQVEVAEMTGMDLDLARRYWRALGFPDVELEERMFTDLDIEALVILRSMMDLGVADVDTSLQFARVIGSSMARIAEAEVSPQLRGLAVAGGTGSSDTVEAADRFAAAGGPLPARHGAPARVRVAPPRPGRGAPGHAPAQPERQRGAAGPGGGLRRHGGVHDAQPAALRRGARGGGGPFRRGRPRHGDGGRAGAW